MARFILACIVVCSLACATAKDPYTFEIGDIDRETVTIPDGCAHFYESNAKVVAVGEFANNTSFQDGRREFEQAAMAIGFSGAAAVYTQMSQDVTPQIGEFAQSAMESTLVGMGGAKVVSRSQMEAILQEQQFQMTLADPNTVVEFGRMSGAQYIVTGSVDNINIDYTSPVSTDYDTSDNVGILLALGSAVYNAVLSGWNLETTLTVNVIDVSTGQIVATQKATGDYHIGDAPTFSVDQVIEGSKRAMTDSLYKILAFFNEYFEMRSYINELRGNKAMARISAGTNSGIGEGDKFVVMDIIANTDFLTGQTSCSMMESKVTLTVTSYNGEDFAWTNVSANESQRPKVKIGSLLRRVQVGKR